ncbi:MAG: hypothetical protein J6Z03_08115 [Erysipelotrichaceae bacterium]|nr:hypothetical protein [Erysipelotrichaceae bacterium]
MENKNLLDEEQLSEVSGGIVDITKMDPSFLTEVDELKLKGQCYISKGKGWKFSKLYDFAIKEILPGIQRQHDSLGIPPVSDEYFKFRLEQIWVGIGGTL